MSFNNVSPGKDIPNDFNVIIEIPAQSDPVKYEADKETGLLFVDRFVGTGMRYPANYGFIPQTLSGDGDPVDVLVVTPFPLIHGCVVRCRALGMLKMTDESGVDAKLVAVPVNKLSPATAHMTDLSDIGQNLLDQIKHFSSTTRRWKPASGSRSKAGAALKKPTRKSSTASPTIRSKHFHDFAVRRV